MMSFAVTITTLDGAQHHYTALGSHCFDVWDEAVTTFGVCKVKVSRR
ncbi:hypothetical protein [Burkholderia ubonensis]|nr:hypothetical protein [Burkholderia ubonensis]